MNMRRRSKIAIMAAVAQAQLVQAFLQWDFETEVKAEGESMNPFRLRKPFAAEPFPKTAQWKRERNRFRGRN